MQIDANTLRDLHLSGEEESLLDRLDFTTTRAGKDVLRRILLQPHSQLDAITETQEVLKLILSRLDQWPRQISNGTLQAITKFLETPVEPLTERPGALSLGLYRMLHASDASLIRYSATHALAFVQDMKTLALLLQDGPRPLRELTDDILRWIGQDPVISALLGETGGKTMWTPAQFLRWGARIHQSFRVPMKALLQIHAQLDAWYSMAMAHRQRGFRFPEFIDSGKPCFRAEGLFHPLLEKPVPYDVALDESGNFLFLTGANMAGKSTFIKAVGTAVYLAHTGMGVPAADCLLSLFNGLLSNLRSEDSVVRGESFFFNEVRRIRDTLLTVQRGGTWLILIDEMFRGTNREDAMKCSQVVMEGLLRQSRSLYIVSTHLYESGEALRPHTTVLFRYFETLFTDTGFHFTYTLREGISQDRIGYQILEREGVVDLIRRS